MRVLLLVTTLSLASAYLKPVDTCESEKYKHANRSVAVCVTGLYRTAKHVMPHLRRQYPPDKFATFVVTDGIDKMRHYRSKRVCKYLAPTLMHDLPTRQSSQHAGLVLCSRLIEEHERKIKRRYDWVVRQRIDTLGCTPSPAIAGPSAEYTTSLVRRVDGVGVDKVSRRRRRSAIKPSWYHTRGAAGRPTTGRGCQGTSSTFM